jgi:imidazole glycerol phosphate synthase glutamine amidotransferase subunit
MITIVDYGAGNLRSVENTLAKSGAAYCTTRGPAEVRAAEKIILPGVGHFGQMMRALDELGLRQALIGKARSGVPFLGICLGLQAMFETSAEAPGERGLALFAGRVERFPLTARVPHMGWNEIIPVVPSRLLSSLGAKPYVYFAHSFYCPLTAATAAACEYTGIAYTAVLESGNVFGVQFHPEKSGPLGLEIIGNFVRI